MVIRTSKLNLAEKYRKKGSFCCDSLKIFVDEKDGSLGIHFYEKGKGKKKKVINYSKFQGILSEWVNEMAELTDKF